MSARQTRSPDTREWLVYRLGGATAAKLGTVKAPDMQAALQVAFREFDIPTADQRRIIVQPISTR